MTRHSRIFLVLLGVVGAWPVPRTLAVEFEAAAFGATGDGTTDDGPAISRMVQAASAARGSPVTLRFGPKKTYRIQSSPGRYLFRIECASNLTIDGGGSTFLLAPSLRFLALSHSDHVTVRGLNVDFDPLPFIDGTVTAVHAARRRFDIRLAGVGAAPLLGGPTREDGEQAFFAMLWHAGTYGPLGLHCPVEKIEAGTEPGTVSLLTTNGFNDFNVIEPGSWRISLPVAGNAHRYGPGACFDICDNDTVTFEDVELWSAPWFGFVVARNAGQVVFRRTHIRPQPGTLRLMSTWRDGFHVKANRASLLWDACIVTGMNDDAFNISTHTSRVSRVESPVRFEVQQKFPLLPVPWRAGGTLFAADETRAMMLGRAAIVRVETGPAPPPIQGEAAAPNNILTIDRPIPGLAVGAMVWDPDACNPDTTLRGCQIGQSCRIQSPLRLESCQVDALLWFYAEPVEGAYPHDVSIRNCTLRRGRGNPGAALLFSGAPGPGTADSAWATPRAIHDIVLTNNRIWGGVTLEGTERARLTGNEFLEPGAPLTLHRNLDLRLDGNLDAQHQPLPAP